VTYPPSRKTLRSPSRGTLRALADAQRLAEKETKVLAALEARAKETGSGGLPEQYLKWRLEACRANRQLFLKWRARLLAEVMADPGSETPAPRL